MVYAIPTYELRSTPAFGRRRRLPPAAAAMLVIIKFRSCMLNNKRVITFVGAMVCNLARKCNNYYICGRYYVCGRNIASIMNTWLLTKRVLLSWPLTSWKNSAPNRPIRLGDSWGGGVLFPLIKSLTCPLP